jgi:hypothetical protein
MVSPGDAVFHELHRDLGQVLGTGGHQGLLAAAEQEDEGGEEHGEAVDQDDLVDLPPLTLADQTWPVDDVAERRELECEHAHDS